MLALSLSPDVVLEIELHASKIQRLAAGERPLDLARLRDAAADFQALLAEATHLERRALGQGRHNSPRPKQPVFNEGPGGRPAIPLGS